MARRIEVLSGFLAGFSGVVGLGIALFGDTRTVVENGAVILSSLWSRGLDGQEWFFVIAMAVAALLVGAAAYVHVTRGGPVAMLVIWIGTAALAIGVLVDLPESTVSTTGAGLTTLADTHVGIWLIPAAILGLVSAVSALVRHFPEGQSIVHQPR